MRTPKQVLVQLAASNLSGESDDLRRMELACRGREGRLLDEQYGESGSTYRQLLAAYIEARDEAEAALVYAKNLPESP